jgi:hypothetical protein
VREKIVKRQKRTEVRDLATIPSFVEVFKPLKT